MLKEVSGDILLTETQAIVHGVAPMDDFKQGLALSLRERWPALYKDFRRYCKTYNPKPGEIWTWKGAESPYIINLLTQEPPQTADAHPGRSSLPNVNHALKGLEAEIERLHLKSLAITRLATGVGGLAWSEVKPMLESHLEKLNTDVYIYSEFHKGLKAQES